MGNQWGRSGNGAVTRTGGGAGAVVMASFACLVLGAAAGYGFSRLAADGAAAEGEIARRDATIASLEREAEAAGRQAEERLRDLQQKMDALRDQREEPDPGPAAEVAPGLERELKLAAQRIADAEALRGRAEEAVRERERRLSLQADRIARLEKALAAAGDAERQAAGLRQDLDAAKAAAAALRDKEIPALRAELSRKDADIAALGREKQALAARAAAAEKALAERRGGEGGETPARDNAEPAVGLSPRNAALVAAALGDAPGLERLSTEQRGRLERLLVSGECVTNALGTVFSRVPILTLRNLMRDLDADC